MLHCEHRHEVDGLVVDSGIEKSAIRPGSGQDQSDKTSLALVEVTGGVTIALEIHLGL